MLQEKTKHGKLLVVENGHVKCPYCRITTITRTSRIASGTNIPAYCRTCKHEINIDYDEGQCYLSQSQ